MAADEGYQHLLGHVRILVFIHVYLFKLITIKLRYPGVFEYSDSHMLHIVKVDYVLITLLPVVNMHKIKHGICKCLKFRSHKAHMLI